MFLIAAGGSLYIQEKPAPPPPAKVAPLSLLPETLKKEVVAYRHVAPYADTSSFTLKPELIKQIQVDDDLVIFSNKQSAIRLSEIPDVLTEHEGTLYSRTNENYVVELSLVPGLQTYVENVIKNVRATHVGAVAMNPQTGEILAMAARSHDLDHAVTHAGYPAASLFKIVTSSAALELSDLKPVSEIHYRGGTYTLNRVNYKPHPLRDNRSLTFRSALAKSCNPVFSRIALGHLNAEILEQYIRRFHFNQEVPFDVDLMTSSASIPTEEYGLGRTAAGFGAVTLSPVQAAALIASIANKGRMPAPYFAQRIFTATGSLLYQHKPGILERTLLPETADTLRTMMEETVLSGTSRSAFMKRSRPILNNLRVSGKTGTLTGSNPRGLTRWFVGLAPVEAPRMVVAIVVVNPRSRSSNPSYLAQKIYGFANSANLLAP